MPDPLRGPYLRHFADGWDPHGGVPSPGRRLNPHGGQPAWGSVPAAPTGLTADADGPYAVDLAWTGHASGAHHFLIFRSADGTHFAHVTDVSGGIAAYHDEGLVAETAYTYAVACGNQWDTSARCDPASATTGAVPVVPPIPAGLDATAASSSAIDLSWSTGGAGATTVAIERSPDGDTWAEIDTVAGDTTEYADTGLEAETAYHYRVRGHNDVGYSAYSAEASATTEATPSGPAILFADDFARADGDLGGTGWAHDHNPPSWDAVIVSGQLRVYGGANARAEFPPSATGITSWQFAYDPQADPDAGEVDEFGLDDGSNWLAAVVWTSATGANLVVFDGSGGAGGTQAITIPVAAQVLELVHTSTPTGRSAVLYAGGVALGTASQSGSGLAVLVPTHLAIVHTDALLDDISIADGLQGV